MMQRYHSISERNSTKTSPAGSPNPAFVPKKKVVFSQNDEVRIFEPAPDLLRYDDHAFSLAARKVLSIVEYNVQMGKTSSWLMSFFQSSSSPVTMSDRELYKFKDAFEYRLKALPEIRTGKVSRADVIVRELVTILQTSGWPNISDEKENISSRVDIQQPSSAQKPVKRSIVGDAYYTSIDQKRSEVQMLTQKVRANVSKSMSVESLILEIKNLFELANSTQNEEIRDYCRREMKTMEYMLEDMGFVRSQDGFGR